MGRIRGKFAPLFDELGEDDRWLFKCNDRQKLLYNLILLTIYTTNGTAPDDPEYYRRRYALVQRKDSVRTDLAHIKALFPKLVCTNKKLSLLNSTVYENRVATIGAEKKKEKKKERERNHFIPPTLAACKEYFNSLNAPLEADAFFDHHQARNWILRGHARQMSDWKAAARNWLRPKDFKKVTKDDLWTQSPANK